MELNYNIEAEWADKYFHKELTADDLKNLHEKLAQDQTFATAFYNQLSIIKGLKENAQRAQFRQMLKDIHKESFVQSTYHKIIPFINKYWKPASIAASVALLTSIFTVWSVNRSLTQNNASQNIKYLKREIETIKRSQNNQQQQIESIKDHAPSLTHNKSANASGTGFAITNNGYIITNNHVVENADSIFVQVRNGQNYKAKIVAFEPNADLAILKIETNSFRFSNNDIPYRFSSNKALLGTRIYSFGFPQDDIVYTEGYIASKNGLDGDSLQYRLSLPAYPGQSGAPVLDDQGNLIGMIECKETQAEGSTFAISSKALLRLIKDLPLKANIKLNSTNKLSALSRVEQLDRVQNFTCMVQVFKN